MLISLMSKANGHRIEHVTVKVPSIDQYIVSQYKQISV